MQIPEFPFLISPGIKGNKGSDGFFCWVEFNSEKFIYDCIDESGGGFAFRLKKAYIELKKLYPRDIKEPTMYSGFYRQQYGVTPQHKWFPIVDDMRIIEHRVIKDQRSYDKYLESARNQNYSSVYIRRVNDGEDVDPIKVAIL